MKQSLLLDQQSMKERALPSWFFKSYDEFKQVVLKNDFPCFFGRRAEKVGELRYSFLPHADWSELPRTLRQFLLLTQERPLVRRGLFVFVEPEEKEQSLEYYRQYFWDVMQYLNIQDKKRWPLHTPSDPNHYLWSFCFDEQSIFAFANAPAYKQRKTRDLGQSMVIGFQPRIIFEGLEGTDLGGIQSRQAVRERVEKWDQIPKHPDISHYGDPNHHEWKQFFISDNCEPIKGGCPFKAIQKD
ncbi:hypothetical protein BTS2_0278 [Bacillus sp. TS-2]|nr:hypothetical protein BTS2_0278 [Bacillus sp. TS-2]